MTKKSDYKHLPSSCTKLGVRSFLGHMPLKAKNIARKSPPKRLQNVEKVKKSIIRHPKNDLSCSKMPQNDQISLLYYLQMFVNLLQPPYMLSKASKIN